MYHFFGIKACLTAFGTLCGVVMVVLVVLMPPAQPDETLRLASSSVSLVSALMLALGQTPIFPRLCRLPGVNIFLPDLEGRWTGFIESNWPLIQERSDLPPSEKNSFSPKLPVTIKITSRLFFVCIELNTDSRYSDSKTIFVRACRDNESGAVRLYYIYENNTPVPDNNDSSRHYGAAYLDLRKDDTSPPRLEGFYWTNRNWCNALNTAGHISLTRTQ